MKRTKAKGKEFALDCAYCGSRTIYTQKDLTKDVNEYEDYEDSKTRITYNSSWLYKLLGVTQFIGVDRTTQIKEQTVYGVKCPACNSHNPTKTEETKLIKTKVTRVIKEQRYY